MSNYTAIFPAFKLKGDFEVLHYIFKKIKMNLLLSIREWLSDDRIR